MKKLLILFTLLLTFTSVSFAQRNHIHKPTIPVLIGDGFTDDTEALNEWGKGRVVIYKGKPLGKVLQGGKFYISWRIDFNRRGSTVRRNVFIWHYTGYDRLDWVNYGKGVKHYRNKIIDKGAIGLNWRRQVIESQEKEIAELKVLVYVQRVFLEAQQKEIYRLREKQRLKVDMTKYLFGGW